MLQRLITFLALALIGFGSSLADDIDIPVSPDDENPDGIYGNKHRSAPIQHWCTIDIEGASITSSVNGIICYEIIAEGDNAAVVSTPSPTLLIDRLKTLPEGQYTIRLITPDRSYSGSFYLSARQT